MRARSGRSSVRKPSAPASRPAKLPPPQPSRKALAAATLVSLVLHAMLIAAVVERADAPAPAKPTSPALVTRLIPSLPLSVPEPPPLAQAVLPRERAATPAPAPAPEARQVIPLPSIEPVPVQPPAPAPSTRVTVNVDEGAIEPEFERLLRSEHATARRVPLDFEEPVDVVFPPAALRDIPQRRLRALVLVRGNGELELLRTHEDDAVLVPAIRNALERARAKPALGTLKIAPGWALVIFWFERA